LLSPAPASTKLTGQGTFSANINDFGVVTGAYTDSSGNNVAFAGRPGRFTTVSDPAGEEGTAPQGISNVGLIVGFYVDSSGNVHGFELSPAR
jgi:hypothetical protein